ncbi:alpha/beta hydrolase [Entomomonas moraniae]|uniref:Alpha/beta hydrolase n=1 Tax=Entomomonas moraniae TaxID=2213226 RepID=A0A3S9XDZ7_9GAMM|nr:alpha/beta hydrolase [Entomomonas moraniae]AZS50611.1 alpha/beta hydrolase [Entomomonas moraniae]
MFKEVCIKNLQPKEITIQLPHIQLAALEYGDAQGKPVLALHGWLDNAMSFARLAPKLEGMHVIALDLMGHGLSGHKPAGTGYQLWEAAFSAVAVAQALGWQQYSLLGHSLGAILSVMVASICPQQVERLMLIDGLIAIPKQPEEFPAQLQQAMLGLARSLHKTPQKVVYSSLDEMIKRRQNGFIPLSYEAARLLMERGAEKVDGGYCWRSDSQLMIPSPCPLTEDAAWSYAEQRLCPINLVVARQGLLAMNPLFMKRLATLPNCQVNNIEGTHHLHLESEEAAKEIAESFNQFMA